jgi:hypothetical protein
MKSLRRLFASSVLARTFTISVFAGEMQFPGVTQPPPSQPVATREEGSADAEGIIHTGAAGEASDPAFGAALSLLRAVLALF